MDDDDPLVDTVVANRYRVLRRLGEGGMSIVYEVQHTKLARAFAMKRLLPLLLRNQEAVQRFEHEAELLASLRHPNVVDISDWVLLDDGSPCMILEFLHGASLSVRLQREALPWETIARMGDQMMSALQLAHRMGIIHRDLKPDNIFIQIDDLGEERVKLVDFGVSKLTGRTGISGVHEIIGTPSYMSPEQAQGLTEEVGPSTDVWAMGSILYEMATQKVAFDADSVAEALMRIVSGRPDPLVAFRKDAPPAFVELVECALARDARRILTIDDLRSRLKRALATPPAPVRTASGRVATPVATPRLSPTPPRGASTTSPTTPPANLARSPTPPRGGAATTSTPPLNVPRTMTPPTLTPPNGSRLPGPQRTDNPFRAEGTAIDDRGRRMWTIGVLVAVVVTAINLAIAFAL